MASLLKMWLALTLLTAVTMLALPDNDLFGSQQQLVWAAITVLLAQLLGPLAMAQQTPLSTPAPALAALGQGLAAGLAFLCSVPLLTSLNAVVSASLWLLCAGIAILVILSSLAQQALQLRQQLSASLAAAAVTITTLILMLAPLWLGPLAASGSENMGAIALFISPLSLLAGLADIDFMRSSWSYRYSELAAMPVTYPPLVLLLALYGGLMIHTRSICLRTPKPAPAIPPETH
ncbi:hypothetical protein EYC98_05505 [Halieaceae bacterium IMCC14734]|uniref:Uncharacterized protein n=1 Tax=Candidatus Litorirhabdus singularis TaxID=2518993 RepID=A0ABT3TDR1_9GAMM|nr:hypothetical protein [Candidatus Litorirhabdus singularis]MCX2980325.1 hypothetical protein [Candidatus Litorirhabdus singularis]